MTRLVIHTSAETLANIQNGQFRFILRVKRVLESQGWQVGSRQKRRGDWLRDRLDGAYHLHEIIGARGARGLNFRRAYFYPWWMFYHPDQRYTGRIAGQAYDPAQIDRRAAAHFQAELQHHCLPGWARSESGSYALVPLQAKLTQRRTWQFADLATLVRMILQHDPGREIVLKPHPKLAYSPQENALLAELCQHPLVRCADQPMAQMMGGAAYIATHNSAAAFEAMVLGIPSILFAEADFHHICPQVKQPSDAPAAFAQLLGRKPDFARYLYWFLEQNCLHAGRGDAEVRIATLLRECGWPVEPVLDL